MGRPSNAELAARAAETGNPGEGTNQTTEGANTALATDVTAETSSGNLQAPESPVNAIKDEAPDALASALAYLQSLGYSVSAPNEAAAAEKTDEEKQESLQKVFGEGFVTAYRDKDGTREYAYWTREAWNAIDGDKAGWRRQVKKPVEVEELEAKKANQ